MTSSDKQKMQRKLCKKLLTSILGNHIIMTIKLVRRTTMKKEEILEKSRNENKDADELEAYVAAAAGKTAAKIGMIVCCIVSILQIIISDTISYESWMIYFSIMATISIVKYFKLHKKNEMILSIIFSVFFIFFTVLFILRLAGIING